MSITQIKNKILPALKQRGVVKAAIFGSVVKNQTKKNSDIDILVEFQRTKSLLELVNLKAQIENKLQKKADILTYNSLNPLLKDRILNEQKIIYEKRS